jgi:glutamine amidotransferase
MTLVVVDYGSGNLRSVAKACERAVADAGSALSVIVSSKAEDVAKADRVILPGVGAFADCKSGLTALPGMIEALEQAVLIEKKPFLGICVGMQLLASLGLEHGRHVGLGWIKGEVRRLNPSDTALKIPHMGWNELIFTPGAHSLLHGLKPGDHAYFVHSYHFICAQPENRLAHVVYGEEITALIGLGNIAGTQFHPEKSQANGLKLLGNFLKWTP